MQSYKTRESPHAPVIVIDKFLCVEYDLNIFGVHITYAVGSQVLFYNNILCLYQLIRLDAAKSNVRQGVSNVSSSMCYITDTGNQSPLFVWNLWFEGAMTMLVRDRQL